LTDLAATVLPESLGRAKTDAIALQFERWVQEYRAGAEMQTGYGTTRVRYKPASPAPSYLEQLEQLSSGALVQTHPALKGIASPDRLGVSGVQGALVTKGGLVFIGGGDMAMHAVDKTTGADIWTYPLKLRTTSSPSTYRTVAGKQFVVICAGNGPDASLMAFALAN
jgi:hypothetical protein